MVGDPNSSGKTTVFPRLLPNFYFENVLNMSVQMRGRNVPIQSRVISTPRFIVGRKIESTVNTQLSFSFSTRPLTVNSQQSTVNNNSGATGIDITHLPDSFHPSGLAPNVGSSSESKKLDLLV